MSSDYRVLCLTHDPALELGDDGDWWQDPEPAFAAVNAPSSSAVTAAHAGCDLLVGRYPTVSYPLFEVACPPSRIPDNRPGHRGNHGGPKWIDAVWLRLLWHANQTSTPNGSDMAGAISEAASGCWSIPRLRRLRYALAAVPADGKASCCPACDGDRP